MLSRRFGAEKVDGRFGESKCGAETANRHVNVEPKVHTKKRTFRLGPWRRKFGLATDRKKRNAAKRNMQNRWDRRPNRPKENMWRRSIDQGRHQAPVDAKAIRKCAPIEDAKGRRDGKYTCGGERASWRRLGTFNRSKNRVNAKGQAGRSPPFIKK